MPDDTAARLGEIAGISTVALAGLVAALFVLLRFLIPMGGILGLLWVLAVSALMLVGRARRSPAGPRRPGRVV
jgi:hypothetical protein